MKFFQIDPEVPGGWDDGIVVSDRESHPPKISKLCIYFDGWMGDGLMQAFPVYFVTGQVAHALDRAGLSGYSLDTMGVTKSDAFETRHPGRQLPPIYWLKVHGTPGRDDFGLLARAELVVSDKALMVLKPFGLNHADIEEYSGPARAGAPNAAVAGGFDPIKPVGVESENAADLFHNPTNRSANEG